RTGRSTSTRRSTRRSTAASWRRPTPPRSSTTRSTRNTPGGACDAAMAKKRLKKTPPKRARRSGRRSSDASLAASEARFRSLIALSSDWYWEQDAEFRFTRFSADHPGKSVVGEPGLMGRRRWEIPAIRLSPEAWAAHRADLEAHRVFHNLEYPVL